MPLDPWDATRLILLVIVAVAMALAWLESAWLRRSPRYVRALAWRRLSASLEALAPTRTTASATASPTYRLPPREPFIDLARLPKETRLADGAVLFRFDDRAEWLAELPANRDRQRGRRVVWLALRVIDDEVRVEAHSVTSILLVLSPFIVPATLAIFTTASATVTLLSIPFTLFFLALAALTTRSDSERLAQAALVEIEHALAETDESGPE